MPCALSHARIPARSTENVQLSWQRLRGVYRNRDITQVPQGDATTEKASQVLPDSMMALFLFHRVPCLARSCCKFTVQELSYCRGDTVQWMFSKDMCVGMRKSFAGHMTAFVIRLPKRVGAELSAKHQFCRVANVWRQFSSKKLCTTRCFDASCKYVLHANLNTDPGHEHIMSAACRERARCVSRFKVLCPV
jgi:hypothetical protein